jgi:hypothetical protein
MTRRIVLLLLALALTACNGSLPGLSPTATPTLTPTSLPTATATPTATPTSLPPRVILLAPPGHDPALAAELQPMLTELAGQAGLRLQILPSLAVADLAEDVRVVIAIPPAVGLAELAAAAPQAQFATVGIPGLQSGGNLSALAAGGGRPDIAGFLAGYIAASITTDWRVGVIYPAETPAGTATRIAFRNGVTYFCGLCLPVYPPFPTNGYPLSVELPAGAGPADWNAAVVALRSWQVETAYISPEVTQPGLLAALSEAGVAYILGSPPPAGSEAGWIASLGYPEPLDMLRSLWPDLLAGRGGQTLALPLAISAANPDRLSPGRQRLAEELLVQLLSGFVDTGVDPLSGETR